MEQGLGGLRADGNLTIHSLQNTRPPHDADGRGAGFLTHPLRRARGNWQFHFRIFGRDGNIFARAPAMTPKDCRNPPPVWLVLGMKDGGRGRIWFQSYRTFAKHDSEGTRLTISRITPSTHPPRPKSQLGLEHPGNRPRRWQRPHSGICLTERKWPKENVKIRGQEKSWQCGQAKLRSCRSEVLHEPRCTPIQKQNSPLQRGASNPIPPFPSSFNLPVPLSPIRIPFPTPSQKSKFLSDRQT